MPAVPAPARSPRRWAAACGFALALAAACGPVPAASERMTIYFAESREGADITIVFADDPGASDEAWLLRRCEGGVGEGTIAVFAAQARAERRVLAVGEEAKADRIVCVVGDVPPEIEPRLR